MVAILAFSPFPCASVSPTASQAHLQCIKTMWKQSYSFLLQVLQVCLFPYISLLKADLKHNNHCYDLIVVPQLSVRDVFPLSLPVAPLTWISSLSQAFNSVSSCIHTSIPSSNTISTFWFTSTKFGRGGWRFPY